MNLADFLESSAARYASRAAVTDVRSGRVLSYRQLAEEAQRVTAFLAAQGVGPGQRIGLIMTEIQVNGCLAWPDPGPLLASDSPAIVTEGVCEGFTFRWIDRSADG